MSGRVIRAAVAVLCIAILCGCAARPEKLVFTEQEICMDIGSAINLMPTPLPHGSEPGNIKYISSDESVGEYINGMVFANSVGECLLSARCGKVNSEYVILRVRDYTKEAQALRAEIDEYYTSQCLNGFSARQICGMYEELPNDVRKIVDNIELARIYAGEDTDMPRVYVSENGKKYHTAGCGSLRGDVREVPQAAAVFLGCTPCSACHK